MVYDWVEWESWKRLKDDIESLRPILKTLEDTCEKQKSSTSSAMEAKIKDCVERDKMERSQQLKRMCECFLELADVIW